MMEFREFHVELLKNYLMSTSEGVPEPISGGISVGFSLVIPGKIIGRILEGISGGFP